MFYTVTANPSLDYSMSADSIIMGQTNRSKKEVISAGGKGINVSIMLLHLGILSRSLAFIAGFTGDEIEHLARVAGADTDFIRLGSGISRINVKLHCGDGEGYGGETEINAAGPAVSAGAIEELMQRLDAIREGDTLVLSGNIPPALPKSFYADIMKRQGGARIAVDATRQLLRECLQYKPFLVKPNMAELGELYGVTLKTAEDAAASARRLRSEGAQNVLVSMGKHGAVLAADDGAVYCSPAPEGLAVNTVGSGDSMLAGFLAGYDGKAAKCKGGARDALIAGVCAGSASAFEEGLASGEAVERIINSWGKTCRISRM